MVKIRINSPYAQPIKPDDAQLIKRGARYRRLDLESGGHRTYGDQTTGGGGGGQFGTMYV